MIKKQLMAILLSALLILTASGCKSNISDTSKSGEMQVLCAAFAEYDWTRAILGENPGNIQLSLLNESGMDMHSYQPSVADMVKIADADLVIFTGGESEFWIEDALISSGSEAANHLCLMEIFLHHHDLSDRYTLDCEEEEGHDHDHGDEEEEGHDHDHEGHLHTTDEHLWLSPKMAPTFVGEIAEALSELDPANRDYYAQNLRNYITRISTLDFQFEEAVRLAYEKGSVTILVADRYPLKYLLEDYGIKHIAAFPGCSAETEASFETILSLSEAFDHLNLSAVAILKKSKTDLAQTVIKNSLRQDAEIIVFDSMQSVTAKDIKAGATWLSVMEENLEALTQALK
ncbi:MAG: zinc ABC transporter substrate-binding protein [Firmicutes bacterium]|nr:zinc ABC transporter substrate-binding protein [Bacillota bacterium]